MRIAFCLHGLSAGTHEAKPNKKFSATKNYNNWKKEIFDKYQVDIFCHTWNEESRQDLTHICKKLQIEEINLDTMKKVVQIDKYPDNQIIIDQYKKNNILTKTYCKYSRFYSMYKSDLLRQEYEKEHNFIYDCVFHTRFEMSFILHLDILSLDMDHLYIVPKLNAREIYYTLKKPMDYVFFSNSKIMSELTKIWIHLYNIYHQRLGNLKYVSYICSHNLLGTYIKNEKLKVTFLQPDQMSVCN